MSLLQRHYDPTEGSIYLDNDDLLDIDASWYRDQLGVVSQDPRLFSETISENIAYGKTGLTQVLSSRDVMLQACCGSTQPLKSSLCRFKLTIMALLAMSEAASLEYKHGYPCLPCNSRSGLPPKISFWSCSQEEIEEAARLSNAHAFITALPRGYSTIVSPPCVTYHRLSASVRIPHISWPEGNNACTFDLQLCGPSN